MILELACDGAFDGPMPGIVDARRHFVDEKLSLMLEEFESQDANVFQGFQDAAGGAFRGALDVRIEARGGGGCKEGDGAAVGVLKQPGNGRFPISPTNRKEREVAGGGGGN